MSSDVYESFINTIRAEAWDEGHAAGWTDAARGKVLALRLLASGVLGVNADTIRAKAWDEGANAYETAVTFRDESLPLTNPYQKEAGA